MLLSEKQIMEAFYNGIRPCKILTDENTREKYNSFNRFLKNESIPIKPEYDKEWLMPSEYKNIILSDYFSLLTKTEEEKQRVEDELLLFKETKSENLLRYMIYISDVVHENNIVIGVGRGSAVSLFTLFLCKIIKINPMKYDIDYTDFFKIKEINNAEL